MNTENQHFEKMMNECKKNHKRRKWDLEFLQLF